MIHQTNFFDNTNILNPKSQIMEDRLKNMTREDFMAFFRDDEKLNSLTADDRVEIFLQVLTGSSDITAELLNELISDYSVGNLEVIQIEDE